MPPRPLPPPGPAREVWHALREWPDGAYALHVARRMDVRYQDLLRTLHQLRADGWSVCGDPRRQPKGSAPWLALLKRDPPSEPPWNPSTKGYPDELRRPYEDPYVAKGTRREPPPMPVPPAPAVPTLTAPPNASGRLVWDVLTSAGGLNGAGVARSLGCYYQDIVRCLRALEFDGWARYDRDAEAWLAIRAADRRDRSAERRVKPSNSSYPKALRPGSNLGIGIDWPAPVTPLATVRTLPGDDGLTDPKTALSRYVVELALRRPVETALLLASDEQLQAELDRRARLRADPFADLLGPAEGS